MSNPRPDRRALLLLVSSVFRSVQTTPLPGQVLADIAGVWTPAGVVSDNASIEVNGVSVSDDYWVFISRKDTEVQVNSSFAPNGFPILVAGSPAGV